jgi:Tol biopolymer transport system component
MDATQKRHWLCLGLSTVLILSAIVASIVLFAFIVGNFSTVSSEVDHAGVAFDISPIGEQIVFASAEGDLFLLELNTRKVIRLTETADIESSPAFSPDGKTIVYAADSTALGGSHIFHVSVDGAHREQLTNNTGVADRMPKYSRDGTRIAFARAHQRRRYSMGDWTWDKWDVCVMDVDGSDVHRLTHRNYYGINGVEFAPDGNSINFSAENNRAASNAVLNVFDVAVEGSEPPKTAVPQPSSAGKYAAWASEPDCSPDAKRMVVISDRESPYKYDMVLIDLESSNANPLNATTVSRYNHNPVFAPDGRRILFLAARKWNPESRPIFSLWSLDIDGKNATELAESDLFTDPVKWSHPK